MPTSVDTAKAFDRESKRLTRRFPSLEADVEQLIRRLERGDRPGDRLIGIGYEAYKVRLPNRSARRGKSGGFRVIYHDKSSHLVLLLLIYSKTERADIPDDVIIRVIEETS